MATLDSDDLNAIAALIVANNAALVTAVEASTVLAKEETLANTRAWVKSSAFNNMIGAFEWSPSAIGAAFSVEIPAGSQILLRMWRLDPITCVFDGFVLGTFDFPIASLYASLAVDAGWTGVESAEAIWAEVTAPGGVAFPSCTMTLLSVGSGDNVSVHLPLITAGSSLSINGWTTDGHVAMIPSLAPKAIENSGGIDGQLTSINQRIIDMVWQSATDWLMLESPEPTYDNGNGIKVISFSGTIGEGGMRIYAKSLMYGGFRDEWSGGWAGTTEMGTVNPDLTFTRNPYPAWPNVGGNPGGVLGIYPPQGTTGGVMVIEYSSWYQGPTDPIRLTFYVPGIGSDPEGSDMQYFIDSNGNPRPRCGFGPGAAMGNPMDRIREATLVEINHTEKTNIVSANSFDVLVYDPTGTTLIGTFEYRPVSGGVAKTWVPA